jgi:hypothetical protein
MQRRIIKGERSQAFASAPITKDDRILDLAKEGYGPDDIKLKMWWKHELHVSRDYIRQLMKRSGFYG